jgi:glycosyltransferase involved in cell wall biosynthesis
MASTAVLARPGRPRLALLRDFPEERWPSMDLCAEMLDQHLRADHAQRLDVVEACPPFRRRLQRLPGLTGRRITLNGDRLLNRHWDYPRHARRLSDAAEWFHVVDHSYAQLVHALPPGRVGVYLHDLDTFRCLLEPARDPRPRWFRAVARRVLSGLQKAVVVFFSTAVVRAEIVRHGLVDPECLVHAPLGCAPEFHRRALRDAANHASGRPYLLHVGSCMPRKRVDVLLEVFARLRQRLPELLLVKVGGEWTPAQQGLIERHGLAADIVHVRDIDRPTLACLYRRAGLVLMPSEAEGFGLPVLEALACGAPVLASDLPVFREVGGAAVGYAPVGQAEAWAEAALELLGDPERAGAWGPRVAQAEQYSWRRHAQIIADTYLGLRR